MATKEEILSTFKSEEGAWFAYREGVQTGYYEAYNSLRNQAAIAALQGLLANPCRNRPSVSNDYVKLAIDYANALVEQIKKK